MAENCNGFGNTGFYKKCEADFKAMRGIFVMKTYDDDGVENKVAAGTEIDDAFILARINDSDPSKRWYPIMNLEEALSERQDPTFYTAGSGAQEFVKQGTRNVSFEIRRQGAEFLHQIEGCSCEDLSFFGVDIENKLRGAIKEENGLGSWDFYPIKMQPSSYYPKLVMATEDNPEHLMVQFQYHINEKDSLLRVYPGSLTTTTFLDRKGLIDVYSTFSSITATGFVVDLTTIYTDGDDFKVEGLLLADFDELYDVTAAAAVSITSVTESATVPGRYTVVHATATVTNTRRLTIAKNGFDFTNVTADTFAGV